ncbi:hypothetical protein SAMN05421813_10917 [Daejeonella rubra]|uniref:Uncharacterized protein n=1 Tax=Daejeonella rubra TaxID=990371 RepID=A0A1G9S072_9SPHI|nr:hypothetical protein SAMN05421813_10917 [Daejeonella rubra]
MVLMSITAKSQAHLIGMTYPELRAELKTNNDLTFMGNKTTEGITMVHYKNILTNDDNSFLFENGICRMYSRVSNKENLIQFIQRLNETSTKVNENTWIDPKNIYRIELRYIKDNPYYAVDYTKI